MILDAVLFAGDDVAGLCAQAGFPFRLDQITANSKHLTIAEARELCGACPRQQACLTFEVDALRAGASVTVGMIAGTLPHERRQLAAELGKLETVVPCGTAAGAWRHTTLGEEMCVWCRPAHLANDRHLKANQAWSRAHPEPDVAA